MPKPDDVLAYRYWQAVGPAAAILGVALPVVGYIERWVSLGLSGGTPEVAFALDLPRAALTSAGPIALAFAALVAVVRLDILRLREEQPTRTRRSAKGWALFAWWIAGVGLLVAVGGATLVVVILLVVVFTPAAWLPLLMATIFAGYRLRAAIRGEAPLSLRMLTLPGVTLLAAAILASAFEPVAVLHVGDYQFAPETPLRAGRYSAVGEANGLIYLRDCGVGLGPIVAVPVDRVAAVTLAPGRVRGATPNLADVISGRRLLVQDGCHPDER